MCEEGSYSLFFRMRGLNTTYAWQPNLWHWSSPRSNSDSLMCCISRIQPEQSNPFHITLCQLPSYMLNPVFSLCENSDSFILKQKIIRENEYLKLKTHIYVLLENVSLLECILNGTKVHTVHSSDCISSGILHLWGSKHVYHLLLCLLWYVLYLLLL